MSWTHSKTSNDSQVCISSEFSLLKSRPVSSSAVHCVPSSGFFTGTSNSSNPKLFVTISSTTHVTATTTITTLNPISCISHLRPGKANHPNWPFLSVYKYSWLPIHKDSSSSMSLASTAISSSQGHIICLSSSLRWLWLLDNRQCPIYSWNIYWAPNAHHPHSDQQNVCLFVVGKKRRNEWITTELRSWETCLF